MRFLQRHLTLLFGSIVFAAAFGFYVASISPSQVPGDPSEYTFIPWVFGIAHPPGYAFYTLLAGAWQRIVAIGSVAYRTHLLAATAGALSSTLVYLIVQRLTLNREDTKSAKKDTEDLASFAPTRVRVATGREASQFVSHLAALFAGLSFAAATDVWQQSIHTNAHIITLLLATTSVFLLIEWWRTANDRWLYAFALIAGFSPTQHLLLVFTFPAYALFIVLVRPRLLLQPRRVLPLMGCFAFGLSAWLYYPLRSPTAPFGPTDITSLESFIHFVSAEGLRVNLFHFGLADQPVRFSVFIELAKLQFPVISLLLAIPGALWLARRALKPFVLGAVFFLTLYAFIINTVQDVMAYLLLPFMMLTVFIGLGAWAISEVSFRVVPRRGIPVLIGLALLILPIAKFIDTAPRVSLANYTVGADWVDTLLDRFAGKSEHAVVLSPWEAMTPIWVAELTEGRKLDQADVNPIYVTTASANPWLDNVFAHLNDGPVYLADYRRAVVEGRLFRLRPEGDWPLWRVVPPGETSVPPLDHALNVNAGGIEILGYSLDQTSIEAGQTAHLTLAMRATLTPTHILMPFATVGGREYRWTTDSRLLTPEWLPNEVIVERYDITLPFAAKPGEYPITLGLSDLSVGRDLDLSVPLQTIKVIAPTKSHIDLDQSRLGDFNAQIGLLGATANGTSTSDPLATITVKPGGSIGVWLNWQAQQQVAESYTVFVHLIDGNNQLIAQEDYTPMGGAFPTQLWIPKWIAGQNVNDPYQLKVPEALPPGDYFIEAGLYGMTSTRRVPLLDRAGGLAGDRVI
ncbi:MAG: DUF2723 domain-containing protein, partial [Thermoflexales bacterium]|nr:DUF2723 domain-containing protein [Thermoflexales bacterium]